MQRGQHFPISQSHEDIRSIVIYENVGPSFQLFIQTLRTLFPWLGFSLQLVRSPLLRLVGTGQVEAREIACRVLTVL